MTYFTAIFLGLVEGVTEFLPISSTAHLIIAARLVGLNSSEFLKTFEVVVQLGAIIAVMVLYAPKFLFNRQAWWRVAAGFVPTAMLGYLVYPLFKQYLSDNTPITIVALGAGGVFLVFFEQYIKPRQIAANVDLPSFSHALIIGLAQTAAFVPGVSRAAVTMVAALLLGYKRTTAAEFSFFLASPTIFAASLLELWKGGLGFSSVEITLLSLGLIAAGIAAAATITFLVKYISTHSLAVFGWYRIVAAVVFWWLLF